jgi:MoaA/NifB/PqqE/SkfB family radical SAM enzyme
MSYFTKKMTKGAINIARRILSDRVGLPHIMAFIKYNSILKFANLIRMMSEIKTSKVYSNGKPFITFLEVNNICNLHCPFCLTGKRKNVDRPIKNMSLQEMKQSIDGVLEYLYFIQLYNWGEPLLNRDLFKFIQYAHEKRIFTMVSSNMNFAFPNLAYDIVNSGLDYFIAAIDGFSPETYSKYRRGGDFKMAIQNLENIIEEKKRQGVNNPFIEWQYVVFKHNQHEIEAARKFANRIGVDYFHPIIGYIEDPEWITTLPEFHADLGQPVSVAKCVRPWTHLNIRADGGVAACCYEFYKKDDFGNIFDKPFEVIWNNEMFVTARQILSQGLEEAPKIPVTICHDCVAKGVRPSFEQPEKSNTSWNILHE